MRLSVTTEERRVQEEVREFLDEHVPGRLPHELDGRIAELRRWQAVCYERRYVGRAWPMEFGGAAEETLAIAWYLELVCECVVRVIQFGKEPQGTQNPEGRGVGFVT